MGFDLTKAMGFDKLGLYYNVKVDGIEGECFNYNVYFDGYVTEEKCRKIADAIHELRVPYEEKDIYMGYLDVSKETDIVRIYLDLGNVKPDYEDISIKGILQALNKVSGIKSVIVNEGIDVFYEGLDDF